MDYFRVSTFSLRLGLWEVGIDPSPSPFFRGLVEDDRVLIYERGLDRISGNIGSDGGREWGGWGVLMTRMMMMVEEGTEGCVGHAIHGHDTY